MMGSAEISGVEGRGFDRGTRRRVAASQPTPFFLKAFFHFLAYAVAAPGARLARSLRRKGLEEIADQFPYGIARWSEKGELIAANLPFATLLRLKPEDVVAGLPYQAIACRIRGRIGALPVLDTNRQRLVEINREDGSTILLDERPCADRGFLTIVTDVTERKSADRMLSAVREEQRQLARRYHEEKIRAEAASRAKTAFLAHLSHDIRTPLNHIIGFADLIGLETYGPLGDERYRSYVADIKTSGEKLLASFAEILEFAELEGGRRTLQCAPVAVEALMRDTLARFSESAARAGVGLRLTETARGSLYADRHCLDRMLGNLVENAIKFTPRGGQVRLGAWAAEDGVVLEVSDTGVGIPEEQLARLSHPFALGDAAFTKPQSGVGLGIAIARAIAELSGGRLAIDSMAFVGTTVAISLPLAPAETGAEARPKAVAKAA